MFEQLLSVHSLLALINVLVIDVVLSGDNAIIIGMATQHLESKQRKKAIRRGILGATALRVGFATIAVTLLGIIGLKLAGGLLLLYVVWKFYRELRTTPQQHEEKTSQKKSGFWQAIRLILVADVSMSLDNVLAVSAAAEENIIILAIGLLISIVLMGLASNRIAKKLQSYPQIQRIGLLVILFVALKMILHGAEEIQPLTAALNLAPLVVTITGLVFVVLHQRLIRPLDEQHILSRLQLHYLKIFLSLTITFILLIFFGHIIHDYLFTHQDLLFSVLIILLAVLIEIIALMKKRLQ